MASVPGGEVFLKWLVHGRRNGAGEGGVFAACGARQRSPSVVYWTEGEGQSIAGGRERGSGAARMLVFSIRFSICLPGDGSRAGLDSRQVRRELAGSDAAKAVAFDHAIEHDGVERLEKDHVGAGRVSRRSRQSIAWIASVT